jgi:S-adenosylmethionine hydrolase
MPVVLFTDCGSADVYVGQVKAVLLERASGVPVVDLLNDAPPFAIEESAHVLAACAERFPAGTVFLAVVDPGVGTPRDAVAVEADGRWVVGPDNGLLSVCGGRASRSRCWSIAWRPERLSASFHGRDLFAPAAAWIAAGDPPPGLLRDKSALDVRLSTDDAPKIVYIDHYGNAWTGLRAGQHSRDRVLAVGEARLRHADVFGAARGDEAFWYENSVGLVEIAANRSSAARRLGLAIGHGARFV